MLHRTRDSARLRETGRSAVRQRRFAAWAAFRVPLQAAGHDPPSSAPRGRNRNCHDLFNIENHYLFRLDQNARPVNDGVASCREHMIRPIKAVSPGGWPSRSGPWRQRRLHSGPPRRVKRDPPRDSPGCQSCPPGLLRPDSHFEDASLPSVDFFPFRDSPLSGCRRTPNGLPAQAQHPGITGRPGFFSEPIASCRHGEYGRLRVMFFVFICFLYDKLSIHASVRGWSTPWRLPPRPRTKARGTHAMARLRRPPGAEDHSCIAITKKTSSPAKATPSSSARPCPEDAWPRPGARAGWSRT